MVANSGSHCAGWSLCWLSEVQIVNMCCPSHLTKQGKGPWLNILWKNLRLVSIVHLIMATMITHWHYLNIWWLSWTVKENMGFDGYTDGSDTSEAKLYIQSHILQAISASIPSYTNFPAFMHFLICAVCEDWRLTPHTPNHQETSNNKAKEVIKFKILDTLNCWADFYNPMEPLQMNGSAVSGSDCKWGYKPGFFMEDWL